MAQNECQMMDKSRFYDNLRGNLSSLYDHMKKLERISEFLNTMDQDTATDMTMDAQTTADVGDLRIAINEYLAFYRGEAQTQTVVLKDSINKLRYL